MAKHGSLEPLIVIVGYNAIGKSHLALEVAQNFDGEIVSADSRQVYRFLDIGTAKVTAEERELVPHHLIDVVDPMDSFTLSEYQQHAFAAIDHIHRRGKLPVMTGGTGLYVWSVVDNLSIPSCPPDETLRQELAGKDKRELVELLAAVDPVSAEKHDLIENPRRLLRALEVSLKTGIPYSQQRRKGPPRYNSLQIGLTMPLDKLFERIDDRVDRRFEMGMVDEVETLLQMGATHNWLEKLGMEYRYISRYLRGEINTLAETAAQLKQSIHQYTRRQKTWFKRDKRIVWVDAEQHPREKAFFLINRFLEDLKAE